MRHPDTERDALRLHRRLLVALAGVIGFVALAYTLYGAAGAFDMMRTETTNRVPDWPRFYETEVSRFFKLPPEARVVLAEKTSGGFEYRIVVRFTLPGTRSPEHWVRTIAEESGIAAPSAHRKGKFLYDAGGDGYSVEYLESLGVFQVLYAID
jgi:hypothetical protein